MKRVCTLRKVIFSVFKGPLRKVIFYRSLILWLFIATQFLLFLSYLQPGNFSCCKYKYIFRNLQVFEHFFQKKANFLMFFIK